MSTNPNTAFHSDTSKDERLEALKNDARQGQPMPMQGQTYLSRAVADAGAELGRWRHLGRETTVVGARPLELDTSQDGHSALALERQRGRNPIYPQQPGNVWAADMGNVTPPLGISVNDVLDMETVDGKPRAKAETGKV